MNQITRRHLLSTTAILPVATILASCVNTPPSGTNSVPTPTIPTWIAGIESIGALIGAALPELQAVGLSGSALATVQKIISGIEAAAQAIGATSLPAAGASVLTTIETYLNQLAPVVAPFIALIPGGSVIGLIIAALPAIESAINVVSTLIPQTKALAAFAPPISSTSSAPHVSGAIPAPQDALNELRRRAGR